MKPQKNSKAGSADVDSGDAPLPALRPDLRLHPGPAAADGSPTLIVYDPLSRTYDRFSWHETAILGFLTRATTLSKVMAGLQRETTLRLSPEAVLAFCRDLVGRGLTRATLTRPPSELDAERRAKTIKPLTWLLHHYLYFRIPLLRPDAFLGKTLRFVRPLASTTAFILYFLVGLTGLGFVTLRHETFFHTFQYFFNLKGLLWYGSAIAVVKVAHEFSHAYAAKSRGVRVPVMGAAFIVMWPVAFCDVTDTWKIPERKNRLPIAAAGIISELVIAGFCLVGWAMSNPGILQSLFFVVSTASLISTLMVNLNPAMSFDGYYILMDISGIDNLRSRSFNYTRYLFRKYLLGMALNPPEKARTRRIIGYVTYSVYSWAYRFFLYIGIALLVYYKFTKLLGAFLFSVEIWWFIALPIFKEISAMFKMKHLLKLNARLITTGTILCAAVAWFAWPMPHTYSAPAVIEARQSQPVYAPFSGVITEISTERNNQVKTGDLLLSIASVPLKAEIQELALQKQIVSKEINMLFLQEQVSLIPQKSEEKQQISARLQGLVKKEEQYHINAQIPGIVTEWDPTLRVGRFVRRDQIFGEILNPDEMFIEAYISEDNIADVSPGDEAKFLPSNSGRGIPGRITRISPSKASTIRHRALTSLGQGELPALQNAQGKYDLLEARYPVEIKADRPLNLPVGQSGEVRLKTSPRSWLMDVFHNMQRIVLRESNF